MKPIILKLDIKNNTYDNLFLQQSYDYPIEAYINDLGESMDLTGATAQIHLLKASDTFIIETSGITISGNKITFTLKNTFTNKSGQAKLQIVLTKDGLTFGSWVIKCNIREGAVTDDSIEDSLIIPVIEELKETITEAEAKKQETEQLIQSGNAVTKGELDKVNASLETKANKNDVAKISSGTPLFASSTSGMTDTTKNYVNTTDGYLYSYTGGAWTKTTVQYQSSGISDLSINERKTTFINDNSYDDNIWNYGDLSWLSTGVNGSVAIELATLNINGGTLVNGLTQFFSLKLDMSNIGEECLRFRYFQNENGGGLQVGNVDVTKSMLDSNGVCKFDIHSASKSTKIYVVYQKSTTIIPTSLNVYMKNIRLRLNKNIDLAKVLNSNITIPKVSEVETRVNTLENIGAKSIWNNKDVLIIGDSITDDTYGSYKKWQYYWQQSTSATMTCDGTHARGFVIDSPSFANSSLYNRIKSGYYSATKNYKMVLVFLGTNDWANNIPMGVSGGTDYGVSFIPTVEYCLKWLRETYLDAKICVLLPLQRSNIGVLGQGLYLKDYNNEIAKLCQHYSIPYLDLYKQGNFFPNNQKFSERWSYYAPTGTGSFAYDGLHPNEEFGRTMLMPTVLKFLENI